LGCFWGGVCRKGDTLPPPVLADSEETKLEA